MATTLPGSSPSFDRGDVSGTVKRLCSYTQNLQENLDFMLGQIRKDMAETKQAVSSQGSAVNAMQNSYNALVARVEALEQKVK